MKTDTVSRPVSRRLASALLLFLIATVPVIWAAPAAPTELIAVTQSSSQIQLSWQPVAGATSYTVRRATTSGGTYNIVQSGVTNTQFLDSGRTNGTTYFYRVYAVDGSGTSATSNIARGTALGGPVGSPRWPLANSTAADADVIRFGYGPRRISGSYDFHAGMDLPTATVGVVAIYSVMDGTLTASELNNPTAGNKLLLNHGNQMWTAYLHMHSFAPGLTLNTFYPAGTFLGYVGDTGANSPHLHFTYMVGLTSEANNESKSRNPLEIFPHTSPAGAVTANFDFGATHRIRIQLPAQRNTIRWIIVRGTKSGQPISRIVDYYDIVAQGSTNRNSQNQYGLHLDVDAPAQPTPAGGGTLTLYVKPASGGSNSFDPNRIIIRDFKGNVLVDQSG